MQPSMLGPEPMPNAFDRFWEAYPRKVSKKAALVVWRRINPSGILDAAILAGLAHAKTSPVWRRSLQEPGTPHIPHASTWLNQERWKDEPVMSPPAFGGVAWTDDCAARHQSRCSSRYVHDLLGKDDWPCNQNGEPT